MNTEQDNALLPCPFCGEAEGLITQHYEGTIIHPALRIYCDNCGASSGYSDRVDPVENWNRRAALQSQDREDAERYRWLRKHWFTMTSCYDGGRVEFTTGQPRYSSATEADVDEAIDHARRAEGDGNKC